MRTSYLHKQATNEIIAAVLQRIKTDKKVAALSFTELHGNLSGQARQLSDKICSLRPNRYGISRSAVIPQSPKSMVVISGQTYSTTEGRFPIPTRLLPRDTYRAFQALNHQLKKDTGQELVVQSGYRSPAYQLFIFLFQLKENAWSFEETLHSVALPGYSEHADAGRQGLDLRAARFMGPHKLYDFSRLESYRWLLKNADQFGFQLSYPEDNGTGTKFEPWHWLHSPTTF